MILIVPTFRAIHRHYAFVMEQLRQGAETPGDLGTNHVVLLVRDFGPATAEALGYVRSFRPRELTVLYPSKGPVPPEIQDRWRTLAGSGPDLHRLGRAGIGD